MTSPRSPQAPDRAGLPLRRTGAHCCTPSPRRLRGTTKPEEAHHHVHHHRQDQPDRHDRRRHRRCHAQRRPQHRGAATMQPVTATAVTAMDVAVPHANDTMTAALADLNRCAATCSTTRSPRWKPDVFAAYVRTMDLLELVPTRRSAPAGGRSSRTPPCSARGARARRAPPRRQPLERAERDRRERRRRHATDALRHDDDAWQPPRGVDEAGLLGARTCSTNNDAARLRGRA